MEGGALIVTKLISQDFPGEYSELKKCSLIICIIVCELLITGVWSRLAIEAV